MGGGNTGVPQKHRVPGSGGELSLSLYISLSHRLGRQYVNVICFDPRMHM